jgi:hypothetical protein
MTEPDQSCAPIWHVLVTHGDKFGLPVAVPSVQLKFSSLQSRTSLACGLAGAGMHSQGYQAPAVTAAP